MRRDIANDTKFSGILELNKYYDYETPYGYGGPLSEKHIPLQSQVEFLNEIKDKDKGIVSQFIRFHPLLKNHTIASNLFEIRYLHDTVYMDSTSTDIIMANMDSKNRNMIRKAIKNAVEIERREITDYKPFISLYEETMLKDNADEYYFFNEDYFKIQQSLHGNACFFYAIKEGTIIAGALMYYNENFMHYHLAGTRTEFRKFSPSNLLLYEAACWASKQGIKKFHLGGGITQDDNLFGFKKQFNKNGKLPFYIGRTIFDNNAYTSLLNKRKLIHFNFDINNNRLIQYRA